MRTTPWAGYTTASPVLKPCRPVVVVFLAVVMREGPPLARSVSTPRETVLFRAGHPVGLAAPGSLARCEIPGVPRRGRAKAWNVRRSRLQRSVAYHSYPT